MTDSRTLLLDAAAEEFARHGLKGSRVQSIVQRAGVNERMIYHHFGSKERLYAAVVDHLRGRSGAGMARHIERANGLGPYAGMRHVLTGMFDDFHAHPELIAIFLHEGLAGQDISPFPAAQDLPSGLREIYEAGQRAGTFLADRPFEIAYLTCVGALVGLSTYFAQRFAQSLGRPDLADPEYVRDQIISQLIDGLTGPNHGPPSP